MKRTSGARERLIAAAELLFVKRGFEGVTVKDVAAEAGLHHASIYHHVPGGKSELYVEVMTRNLRAHQTGLKKAIESAEPDLRARLLAVAAWFLAQAPVDMIRMTNSDFPAIPDADARRLEDLAFAAILLPVVALIQDAAAAGVIAADNPGNIAGAIITSVQGLHSIPNQYTTESREEMARELIDVFLRGMQPA